MLELGRKSEREVKLMKKIINKKEILTRLSIGLITKLIFEILMLGLKFFKNLWF